MKSYITIPVALVTLGLTGSALAQMCAFDRTLPAEHRVVYTAPVSTTRVVYSTAPVTRVVYTAPIRTTQVVYTRPIVRTVVVSQPAPVVRESRLGWNNNGFRLGLREPVLNSDGRIIAHVTTPTSWSHLSSLDVAPRDGFVSRFECPHCRVIGPMGGLSQPVGFNTTSHTAIYPNAKVRVHGSW